MRTDDRGRAYISVTYPGMYDLVVNKRFGRHVLMLEPFSDTFAAYSFTFGTACDTTSG